MPTGYDSSTEAGKALNLKFKNTIKIVFVNMHILQKTKEKLICLTIFMTVINKRKTEKINLPKSHFWLAHEFQKLNAGGIPY